MINNLAISSNENFLLQVVVQVNRGDHVRSERHHSGQGRRGQLTRQLRPTSHRADQGVHLHGKNELGHTSRGQEPHPAPGKDRAQHGGDPRAAGALQKLSEPLSQGSAPADEAPQGGGRQRHQARPRLGHLGEHQHPGLPVQHQEPPGRLRESGQSRAGHSDVPRGDSAAGDRQHSVVSHAE